MTVHEALGLGEAELSQVPDPRIDAEWLLSSVLGIKRFALLLSPGLELTRQQERQYFTFLAVRASRKPLQYILGSQNFYGLELKVNEAALIPRPETEMLCERALLCMEAVSRPAVADIGTGSGAIAIVLKKNRPDAAVWATDASPAALALAQENAAKHETEITFLLGDLLEPLRGLTFDCIATNPPYVTSQALSALQPEVQCEPRMALDGGPDGLLFYRRLALDAPAYLNPNGLLCAEFGDGQADAVAAIFSASPSFADVRLHKDLSGTLRIVEARRGDL